MHRVKFAKYGARRKGSSWPRGNHCAVASLIGSLRGDFSRLGCWASCLSARCASRCAETTRGTSCDAAAVDEDIFM